MLRAEKMQHGLDRHVSINLNVLHIRVLRRRFPPRGVNGILIISARDSNARQNGYPIIGLQVIIPIYLVDCSILRVHSGH